MKKRLIERALVLFLMAVTAVCLIVGIASCTPAADDAADGDRQVPIYLGMTVSSVSDGTASDAGISVYANTDYMDRISGDVVGKETYVDDSSPFGSKAIPIEDVIDAEYGVSGDMSYVYCVNPGDDIYITVSLYNPDNLRIMSLTINNRVYSSTSFFSGSDNENIIIKTNAGTRTGITEYTLSNIQYLVGGIVIDDVLLYGDTTVLCGVRSDSTPFAKVDVNGITLDEISLDIRITDLYSLIEESGGYCMVAIYDGETDHFTAQPLSVGENSITFGSLQPNTLYQYAVFAVYDDLAGTGMTLSIIYEDTFYTASIVLFDNVEVTKTGIIFDFSWYDGYDESSLHTKFSLESEGELRLRQIDPETREIDDLLSDHTYTLTVAYTGVNGETESIHLTFTTLKMDVPEAVIEFIDITRTGAEYDVYLVDTDGVGVIGSVSIYKGQRLLGSSLPVSGIYDGLLSDSEYTIVVEYTYDLNDGDGVHSASISETFRTLAVEEPYITIYSLSSSYYSVEYEIVETDADGAGTVTSISLYSGVKLIASADVSEMTGTFDGLYSGSEYTLYVTYEYDLNDGNGIHTVTAYGTIYTATVETPTVTIYSLTSTRSTVAYEIVETDRDGVGEIVSVTLCQESKTVYESADFSGEIGDLLSGTEYTLYVTYEYDLNDGNGIHTVTISETVYTVSVDTPTVTIYSLKSTKTSVVYEIVETDRDGVGEIVSVTLYQGPKAVYESDSLTGEIDGLLSDNEYTLTVVYEYDIYDGDGPRAISVSASVMTQAMETPEISLYSLTATYQSVSYEFVINDVDGTGTVTAVTLYDGVKALDDRSDPAGSFVNLSSDHGYTLQIVYTYDLNDGSGEKTIELSYSVYTPLPKVPEMSIGSITVSKTGIDYVMDITDEDNVGYLSYVTLSENGEETGRLQNESGSFTGLLSGHSYTLTAVYIYNLNESDGASYTITVTETVKTTYMEIPEIETVFSDVTRTSVSYDLTVYDPDGTGHVASVTLSDGTDSYDGGTSLSGEFSGLWSGSEYTLTVVYVYDLNDGEGERTLVFAKSVSTLAKTAPSVEITVIDRSSSSLTFSVNFVDPEYIGKMTGMTLYEGNTPVEIIDGSYTGEILFSGLSPYTLYTLEISYTSDLNDGAGTVSRTYDFYAYTNPVVEFTSISVINTNEISEGETIFIEVEVSNPNEVTFTSVVVNGTEYELSSVSTFTKLRINILNDGRFSAGETMLTISRIYGTLDGMDLVIDVEENNVANVFINGELIVENISVVRVADDGSEETAYYGYNEKNLYYRIDLVNEAGFDVYSVKISSEYTDSIIMTEDRQTLYIPVSFSQSGTISYTFSSMTYGNSLLGERTKVPNLTVSYYALASGEIVEISTVEEFVNTDFTGKIYYRLMADIDLGAYEWINMKNLDGVFDGNGYTISNVKGVGTYEDRDLYLGLFRTAEGIVMNLDLCDVLYMVTLNSTSSSSYHIYAGGLAAYNKALTVMNCNISSSFQLTNNTSDNASYTYIGALLGYNYSYDIIVDTVVCEAVIEINGSNSYYFNGYLGGADIYNRDEAAVYDSRLDYTFTTSSSSSGYIYIDDFRFSVSGTKYTLTNYYGSDKYVVLPEDVDGYTYAIGDSAFKGNTSVEEIVIPDGVKSIGGYAFRDCTSLKYIVIPDSVTSIGNYAFYGCTALTDITIPDGVTSIGSYAFYDCSSLTDIVIPDGVTSIGSYAFYGCTALVDIHYNAVAVNDFSSSNGVFYNAGKNTDGITVTIGAAVTGIPANLFYSTTDTSCAPNIVYVVFESGSACLSIGDYAFAYCTALVSVTIPDSVKSVGNYAFAYCSAMTSVYIPNSVDTIGGYAFRSCTNLSILTAWNGEQKNWDSNWNYSGCPVQWGFEMPSVEVTFSFEPNGGTAVESVTALWLETSPSTVRDGYVFAGWYTSPTFEDDTLVSFPFTSGTDVTLYAKWYSLDGRYQSSGLEIENGVVVGIGTCTDTVLVICMPIADGAFSGCDRITEVYLLDGCTSIGDGAFYNCGSLRTVYFYQTEMPYLGNDMFGNTWDASDFRVYVTEDLYSQYLNADDEGGYWKSYLVDAGKIGMIM